MAKKQITLVVGARPNFMKAAPLLKQLRQEGGFTIRLVHTGQHFDANMSQVFFDQLGLPRPDAYLNVNSGSPNAQVAQVMLALEADFEEHSPDLVMVFGDVNSTLAAALTANKLGKKLAHVEAGLRSFDRVMPEEHNRIATDHLSDFLFTPSTDADENLRREGIPFERIYRVGNIMVDSLLEFKSCAAQLETGKVLGVEQGDYALVTLHRNFNVDDPASLREIVQALIEISETLPVVFPVHPRTRIQLNELDLTRELQSSDLRLVEPQSYLDFLNLLMNARLVLTDSGGIQEESTVLGVACLTLRENTERPITLTEGTNQLVGRTMKRILAGFQAAIASPRVEGHRPELWDGKTAARISAVLHKALD
jgi:UDP-N-acetylglucosamine 2-epimerase (non-hydrolysing)